MTGISSAWQSDAFGTRRPHVQIMYTRRNVKGRLAEAILARAICPKPITLVLSSSRDTDC